MAVIKKYDIRWDEDRCGFVSTKNGDEIAFFPAKSRWDRSEAQKQAALHGRQLQANEDRVIDMQREREIQYDKPLSVTELEWIELDKRIVRFLKDKDQSAKLTNDEFKLYEKLGQFVRRSIIDGTHPQASHRAFVSQH